MQNTLLSAQCISSIGQIIKSVCVSVSQSVSESHRKRVERSTDLNLPPIFTKLATKVESQEMWLPIFWWKSEIFLYTKLEVELILTIFNVKYLENGDRYNGVVNGSRIGNHPWAIDWHHDL